MRVLIVKMSSLGDVIHTLPAITDAVSANPQIVFDWVVEESFEEIPQWHPAVDKVHSIAWRRWRKSLWQTWKHKELQHFFRAVRRRRYDLIIDAQGLLKSAMVSKLAWGQKRVGFSKKTVREPIAAWFYDETFSISRNEHAVLRLRQLFSQALGYTFDPTKIDYGINRKIFTSLTPEPYLLFLHGTTWETKLWPEAYWKTLINYVTSAGLRVKLPWGNTEEYERAQRIADANALVTILPRASLKGMAEYLTHASAVVAVDTGLAHLAAALDVPTLSLYGATNAALTGTFGNNQIHLQANFDCSPCLQKYCTYQENSIQKPACYDTIAPANVWEKLELLLKKRVK